MGAVLWQPCPEASAAIQVVHASDQRDALVSGSACIGLDSLLQQELSAALEDNLSSQISPAPILEGTSVPSTPVKTSRTHPLKFVPAHRRRMPTHRRKRSISTIIPPELLSALSSHVSINTQPSPIILHIPDSYTLHRITGYAQLIPSMNPTSIAAARKAHSHRSRRIPLLPPIPVHASPSAPVHHTLPPQTSPNQPKTSITEALRAAIDAHLTSNPHILNKPSSPPPFTAKSSLPPILTRSTRVHSSSDDSARDSCLSPPQQSSSGYRSTSAPPRPLFPSMLDLLHEREQ